MYFKLSYKSNEMIYWPDRQVVRLMSGVEKPMTPIRFWNRVGAVRKEMISLGIPYKFEQLEEDGTSCDISKALESPDEQDQ